MKVKVRVLYFGPAQEASGRREEAVMLPKPAFLADLIKQLVKVHGELDKYKRSMKVSVNTDIVQGNKQLFQGDEVALLPPVAGG